MTSGINERYFHYKLTRNGAVIKFKNWRDICKELDITRNKMNYLIRNPLEHCIIDRIKEPVWTRPT